MSNVLSNVFILKKLRNLSLATPTQEDYENVEREKTKFELILLSLVVFGIEICYAAETAFVTPILQKIGVPIQYMSMVWGLSPIIGFFACPILGSLSDVCTSRLGRRRPFIIIYSVGILTGLLLTGFGHVIGDFFYSGYGLNVSVILVTVVGVVLLDFDCDACQSPARAYLIDISQNSDHSVGLSMFTLMAGAGGAIGYVLGGIPWGDVSKNSIRVVTSYNFTSSKFVNIPTADEDNYYQTDLAYDHKQILFTCVAVLYVLCTFISVTSFKEIPLGDLNNPNGSGPVKPSHFSYEQINDNNYSVSFEDIRAVTNESSPAQPPLQASNEAKPLKTDINKQSHLETLKFYLSSIVEMPSSLRWLCLAHGLCWMSLLCYSLYFTDFVGEVIYGKIIFISVHFIVYVLRILLI
jgi:solute carrier family 45 protein 1/2/4